MLFSQRSNLPSVILYDVPKLGARMLNHASAINIDEGEAKVSLFNVGANCCRDAGRCGPAPRCHCQAEIQEFTFLLHCCL